VTALHGLTLEEAAELKALREMRDCEPFASFVGRVMPRFLVVPPHLKKLYDLIQLTRTEQVFATISEPPRHGKTTSFALAFAWRILYDPACQNFYTTYADDRSANVGLATMKIVEGLGVPLDPKKRGQSNWGTTFGGGLMSTSIGGQITGEGANGGLVVCDDLIKGSKLARSKAARDDTHNYVTTDVMSRIEGGASLIVMNTRYHDDDVIGRIIKDPMGLGEIAGTKPWIHINMPAVGDENGDPIDERLFPELAHPLWLDVDSANPGSVEAAMRWYALIRARNELAWWSLYQGTPRSESSKIFHEPARYTLPGSKKNVDDVQPFDWRGKRGCIVLDPAATESTKSDFTAIGVIAMEGFGDTSTSYVVDMFKDHISVPAAARLAVAWKKKYKLPLVIESVGGFKSVPQMVKEIVTGIETIAPPMLGDKYTRAQPSASAWNLGKFLVPAPTDIHGVPLQHLEWVEDLIKVNKAFTGADGGEDDVTDVCAHGFNHLLGTVDNVSKWKAMARASNNIRR
jgi:phage terminase large subunit-like protein